MLMGTGDARVADRLNTVHHEIQDSVVRSHHVYKSVWSPVIEQLVLEKEIAGQSIRWIFSGTEW